MAKRTIGFEDYQDRQFEDYTGEDPRPGTWLNAVVNRAKFLPDDDQVVFYCTVVDHPDYAGWTRGVYCPLESGDSIYWKTQDMILALQGGKKQAVTLDWENDTAVNNWLKKAKKIKIKTGEYNERINIRSTRPLLEAVGTGSTARPQAPAATPTPAPAPQAEPADDEALEDYTEDELNGMTAEELEEILTGEFEVPEDELPELTARQQRADKDGSKLKALLVAAVLQEQEDGEDEGDEGEGEAPAADEGDGEFEDGFDGGDDPEPESAPEPEPAPAPRTRRTRAAAAPEPEPAAAPAPAGRTRRTRR